MPDDPKVPAPAVKAPFDPKIGQTVLYTEIDERKKTVNTYPLIVTAKGETTAPKKGADGKPATETVKVKTSTKGEIMVTRPLYETVKTYDGVFFSGNQQFSTPRRGILIDALAEV